MTIESARAQVDGPCHFTANTLRPLGPTLLKRRLIAASGWRVAVVPYYAWNQLCPGYERQLFIHVALHVWKQNKAPGCKTEPHSAYLNPWVQAEPYSAGKHLSCPPTCTQEWEEGCR